MSRQINTLLRVRTLKHEGALRAFRTKQQQLEQAKAAVLRVRIAVEESAMTCALREKAIYASILGRVVDQATIEDAHCTIGGFHKEHRELSETLAQSMSIENRMQDELRVARDHYHASVRNCAKLELIASELTRASVVALERRNEAELEERSSRLGGTIAP